MAQGISQIHPMNGSTPIVRYCDVQGGWFGEGNIDIYPYFRDPGGNDYHLQSASNPICGDPGDSPCIDAGDPAIVDDTLSCDAGLGTLRSDMGAFGGYRQPVPIDDDDVIFPDNVRLLNNYPNPFNARTAIRFALAEPALVEIDVYDLLGRRVGALAPSFCEAGTQAITWDAGGNPSGTYFYRLVAGGKHTTGKMTLLK